MLSFQGFLMKQKGQALIFVLILAALVVGGIYYFGTQKSQQVSQEQVSLSGDFEVVIKENSDKTKSDIYLKDSSGKETFFLTAKDVYKHHIHPAEYKNGNLYIIQRTGGEEGYQDIPDWTDELWKYDSKKQGTKLYSIRGLDFRVSNDNKLIAIIGSGSDNKDMVGFIDTSGKQLAEFGGDDLGISLMKLLVWGENTFWLADLALPYPVAFIKFDTNPFQASKYDVENVGIGMEYVINPDTQRVAYSDYPPLFDVDSQNEYKQSGKKVTLYVYDLETDEKHVIDTSTTKEFNPKWIDDDTIEYDNPKGEGRVTKKI